MFVVVSKMLLLCVTMRWGGGWDEMNWWQSTQRRLSTKILNRRSLKVKKSTGSEENPLRRRRRNLSHTQLHLWRHTQTQNTIFLVPRVQVDGGHRLHGGKSATKASTTDLVEHDGKAEECSKAEGKHESRRSGGKASSTRISTRGLLSEPHYERESLFTITTHSLTHTHTHTHGGVGRRKRNDCQWR